MSTRPAIRRAAICGALASLALALGNCASLPQPRAILIQDAPQAAFFQRLTQLCGRTISGGVMEIGDPVLDADFASSPLVIGKVSCRAGQIAIPFAVGDDHSRTWIITQTATGLRLKHRHAHGETEDALSQYGGDTMSPGTARRQTFPADAFSKDLFTATNRAVSVSNVWGLEIETARPGAYFAYELTRPNRHVRVRFALD